MSCFLVFHVHVRSFWLDFLFLLFSSALFLVSSNPPPQPLMSWINVARCLCLYSFLSFRLCRLVVSVAVAHLLSHVIVSLVSIVKSAFPVSFLH